MNPRVSEDGSSPEAGGALAPRGAMARAWPRLVAPFVAGIAGGGLPLLILGGIPAAGATNDLTVRASAFELVDAAGAVRGGLSLRPDGGPRLTLNDSAGNPRATLDVLPDGSPRFRLIDAAGTVRVGLLALPQGPGVYFADDRGTPRIYANLASVPIVGLASVAGRPSATLEVTNDAPILSMRDASGVKLLSLLVSSDGVPGLEVNAATGAGALLTVVEGGPALGMFDASRKTRLALSLSASGAPQVLPAGWVGGSGAAAAGPSTPAQFTLPEDVAPGQLVTSRCVSTVVGPFCATVPGGTAVLQLGGAVCAPGACVSTVTGWFCSGQPGGGAVLGPIGAECQGGCVQPSPSQCEEAPR